MAIRVAPNLHRRAPGGREATEPEPRALRSGRRDEWATRDRDVLEHSDIESAGDVSTNSERARTGWDGQERVTARGAKSPVATRRGFRVEPPLVRPPEARRAAVTKKSLSELVARRTLAAHGAPRSCPFPSHLCLYFNCADVPSGWSLPVGDIPLTRSIAVSPPRRRRDPGTVAAHRHPRDPTGP